MMDKKQKEALVLALLEKGKTYREIAREAEVSPTPLQSGQLPIRPVLTKLLQNRLEPLSFMSSKS
jgi:hypothetical protein